VEKFLGINLPEIIRQRSEEHTNGDQIYFILTTVERMYLSNTTLCNGRGIYSICYIRYYMFRRLTMAIFRSYTKYLLSSYTKLISAVYMGRVGGEVGAVVLYVMTKLK